MGEFVEDEDFSKSIRRNKDAYRRIKMTHAIEEPDIAIETKYKTPVERIQEVLRVLDRIDKAKAVLSKNIKEKSLEEKFKEYNTFKVLKEELKEYEKTDTIHKILRRIKEYMKETEHFLDEIAKKRLFLLLEGLSHENWAEFLVNKHEKTDLFVNLVKKYAESAIKHGLEDKPLDIRDLLAEIEIFSKNGFNKKQAESVIEEFHLFVGNKIVNTVGKKCYVFVKNTNSSIKKLREFLCFTHGLLVKDTTEVMKKLKIEEKIKSILENAYRPIYKEAEEQFITGGVNEKRLLDKDLFYLLQEMDKIEKLKEFLKKKQGKQRKLKEFYEHSKQKARKAPSKLEGMIFLLNSVHLINMLRVKKLPEKELFDEVTAEMHRKLNNSVENPEKANKIGEILRYVEKTALKAKHYTIPIEKRDYLIEEYKRSIREIASKYGGLDDVSDSHLSETIEGLFNGPIKRIEKKDDALISMEEKQKEEKADYKNI